MTKLEKLKEVNANIKKLIIDLETRIFVENINIEEHKGIKEPQKKVAVELK